MKAINLNKYEYYPQDHRTRKAYRKLIETRNQLILKNINFNQFLDTCIKIIYNDIPTKDLKYFKSVEGEYLLIIRLLVNSESSDAAAYQLKTDLLTAY